MVKWQAMCSGLVGATTLTLLHQAGRRCLPNAPRMDLLGAQALTKSMHALAVQPPTGATMENVTLAGDIVANSLYYSLVGTAHRRHAWLLGGALGLAAGIGALVLPGPLGLDPSASRRTPTTEVLTVAWYLAGGLAAAAAAQCFSASTGE